MRGDACSANPCNAGRSRGIDRTAAEIKTELRKPQLHQPVLVETAMGQPTRALLAALDTAPNSVEDLGRAAAEFFQTHPDYAIIISFPGLAESTGERVFAEIGDDRARFADARALKTYNGSAPVTRASGRFPTVTHRHITEQPARGRRLDRRRSRPPPTVTLPASTTAAGEKTATATPTRPPPLQQTASSTAVCNTTRHLRGQAISDAAVQRGLATLLSRTLTTVDRDVK